VNKDCDGVVWKQVHLCNLGVPRPVVFHPMIDWLSYDIDCDVTVVGMCMI